jgi:PIN domain nuclease of toxin-antitoxin system
MILLDTHIWIWAVHGDPRLTSDHRSRMTASADGLAISDFSCWEVALLAAKGRILLPHPIEEWMRKALKLPNLHRFGVTPRILVQSTILPGSFHPDPADRILVATARLRNVPILTEDRLIRSYPHVTLA